jgi:hypothetical protein
MTWSTSIMESMRSATGNSGMGVRLFLDHAGYGFEQRFLDVAFAQGFGRTLDFLAGQVLVNRTGRPASTADGVHHQDGPVATSPPVNR